MRVLLFDTTAYYPSSPFFVAPLQELAAERGWSYEFVDEARIFGGGRSLARRIGRRILAGHLRRALNEALRRAARTFKPNLVLIIKGTYVFPETLAEIKRATGALLVNYATDDPFNSRTCPHYVAESIPLYDVYACTKRAIMGDVSRAGCPHVVYVPFGYKPEVHFSEVPSTPAERARFGADVAFVGGCDGDRVPYFAALDRAMPDLKLALYGGYWNRDPWLRRHWRGFVFGRDFRLAVCGAKMNVNLVRRANRDGHVMRSFELPACGAFVLAERTAEHQELFAEDREVAYFGSPDELARKIEYYLSRGDERAAIAERGRRLVTGGGHTYKDRLLAIIDKAKDMM